MIAITGATGFIGKYIAQAIPFPQKRLSRGFFENTSHCQWFQGDLNDQEEWIPFIAGANTLLHFACSSTPRHSNHNIEKDLQENLIASVRLFEAFSKHNPDGHIIFSSSGGNMYDASINAPRVEDDVPLPRSSYGIHKLTIEHYLRLFCENFGIRGTIFRMSNPYGTLLPAARPQGLIGVALSKAMNNETLDVVDSLETVRDYVHLEDVASAYNLAIHRPPEKFECQIYNLSSGIGHSNQRILELLEDVVQKPIKRRFLNGDSKPTFSILSSEKLKRSGWTPKFELEQGIRHLWGSVQNG